MNDKVSAEKVATPFSFGINERKRMGDTAIESEQKFRCLVENAAVPICIIDLRGRFTYVNDAMADLLGFSVEELLGRSFKDFLHPSDKGKIMRLFIKIIGLRRQPQNLEFRVIRKDGRVLNLMSKPTRFEVNGKTLGFQAIIVDITKRGIVEEALRNSENKFRTLLENLPQKIFFKDKNSVYISCNENYARDLKIKSDEIAGRTDYDFYPKKLAEKYRADDKRIVKSEKIENIEEEYIQDGQKVFVHTVKTPVKDEKGSVVGILGIFWDITERKKMEGALRKSEEKYRSIVELAPDSIITSDVKGVITSINTAFSKWTGYSKEEIVGKHFMKLRTIHARDIPKYVKLYSALLRGKTPPPIEFVYYTKDGTACWGEAHASILKEDGKMIGLQVILRDITERKKAEEAIRESQQKFERLFMGNPEAAVYWDSDFRVLDINPRFTELFGYSLNEIKGKKPDELIVPEDKMEESNFLGKKAREGILYYDTVRKRKDGSLVPVSMSIAPITVEGQSIGYVGLYKDITERMHAEEALRESEEKYRNLFESARDVILTVNLFGNVTSINKAIENYGWKREDIIGKNMLRLMPKKSWPSLLLGMTQINEGRLLEGEIELISPQGKKIAEYKSNPITRAGKIVGVQVIGRDITERKELEKKLRQYSEHLEELVRKRTDELMESEKRYSVVVEEASDGVFIIQDEKLVFVNKRFAEILGYSPHELIGFPFEKLVAERSRQEAKERYKRILRGEAVPVLYQAEAIAKTGEPVLVEISSKVIRYQGRPADLVILRDITERKKIEEQRFQLERLATMGELATMVAHDLRNPLTSIRNASYYIKGACPYKGNAECKTVIEMFDIIEQETIFANNIINDLLDFSAKRTLQKNKRNINEIAEASIAKSNVPKNISIETHFAKKATVTVDGRQLERVFLNLIKNAMQAMTDGGKLTLTAKDTNSFVEITLADTGVGISEENMSKLFTPLFTTKAKGIGMGLAICKKIVDEHGGTINVKSKVGEGTIFTIKLPKEGGGDDQ